MAIGFRQEQRQTQKLVMTPQMQQSIQLLQMSVLELEQVALQEVAQNPFLEIADDTEPLEDEQRAEALGTPEDIPENPDHLSMGEEGPDSPIPSASDDSWDDDSPSQDMASSDTSSLEDDWSESTSDGDEAELREGFDAIDVDWETAWDGSENRVYTPRDPEDEDRDFTSYVSRRETLSEKLLWQLRVSVHGDKNLKIGEYIIGSLDDDGYLREPMGEIARACHALPEEVEAILKVIQTFDPVGVGARSLTESLTIQLRQKGVTDPVVYALVQDHLDGLQKKKFRELAKTLDTTSEKIEEAFALISSLDPKPGSAQNADEVRPVLPDVIVREIDDRYVVFMNDGRMGGLRVNEYYRSLMKDQAVFTTNQDKEFVQEKLRGALWLLKNIERRKNTILRVAEAIVDFQQAFFQKGASGLRPLTLREVAEVVGMHESTVARVTSGKYMDTPRGMFELKYFFSPGLSTASGEDASSTSIKEALRQLIENEDQKNPLSDQRISEIFEERGVEIARRTVAKYRDQLKILSAKQRKAMAQAEKGKGRARSVENPIRNPDANSYAAVFADSENHGLGYEQPAPRQENRPNKRVRLADIIGPAGRSRKNRPVLS
jgi:RNA polymerase sigma-54 factor